ncbi:MAG TPA: hypothetical protein VHP31_09160 [Caproicibacter sp.]|nr:hypothetical protein [Caproicibacter sp.]
MKRVITLILCVALLACIPMFAFADGSGNINNGGGSGIGDGSGDSYWNDDDGVRVTVVRASDNKPVSVPIDLTNYNEAAVKYYFKKSKLHYKNGSHLQAYCNSYKSTKPSKALPKIIMESGNANIAAIRRYFCSSESLKKIAQIIGTTYEKLTDGKYKLLLEPIAYFYFDGYKYAMTATEAALYDEALSGGLRSKMVSLTHQQLPLSMYLEHADLGYPAFHGNKSSRQSDSTIIAQLGLGVVKFKDDGSDDGGDTDVTEYRCNTDVITSVTLNSDTEINPKNPASVTFSILGGSYTVTDIVMPAGESQLVWVKWHTPSTPQNVNISVSSTQGYLSADSITAKVSALTEKTPPNPTATDRNNSFTTPTVPNKAAISSSSWSVWSGTWIPNWVWIPNWLWVSNSAWPSGGSWVDNGYWQDEGHWEYTSNSYYAFLSANMTLLPDDTDPTANGKQMRSGYGVKADLSTKASGTFSSWITGAQTAITYFPEFQYKTYWRILDRMTDGLSASFAFKNNMYSTYNRRVHFTPVWYPDGTYTAYTYLEDVWTPAGMLSANLTDNVTIKGSVYDDWHVGPKLVG